MKKVLFLLSFTSLMLSGSAVGTPLQKEHVRGDAQWLLHIDFDALRSSQFGTLMQNDIQAQYQDKIDALAQLLGSDLTRDLRAVTLYGTETDKENPSALFYGSYDKDKLLALLVLNGDYSKSDYEGTTIHHWMDEKDQDKQYGAFAAEDMIVIGQSETSVITALDVLSGKTCSLASKTESALYLLCRERKNAIALAAAVGLPELAQNNEHAATLKNSKVLAALVAEEAGDMKLEVHLEAQDEQAAIQIEAIARGIIAFGMLQSNEYPNFKQLLQTMVLTRQNNALDCTFRYPSAELFEIIKAEIN